MDLGEVACATVKLMEVALKFCQFPHNSKLIFHCFDTVFYSLYFPYICTVSEGEDDKPSDSTVVSFFKETVVDLSGKCETEEFISQEG